MSAALDTCGCRPGEAEAEIWNRPGLERLDYRSSTYGKTISRLRAQLDAGGPGGALAGLRTREENDPTGGLLDAFAVVADVLDFYRERIVNESFLRTAGERRSLLELARLIGYELGPGVAAATWLAFEVEDRGAASPGNAEPLQATVPAGTQIQSVPAQGELPQTFETSAELVARADRNELRPLLSVPGRLASADVGSLYLAGLATRLEPGDTVVLAPEDAPAKARARIVRQTIPDPEHDRTRVDLDHGAPALVAHLADLPLLAGVVLSKAPVAFAPSAVAKVLGGTVSDSKLSAYVALQNWPIASLLAAAAAVQHPRPVPPPRPAAVKEPPSPGFYALRSRLGVFGHNAPRHPVSPAAGSPLVRAGWKIGWDGSAGVPIVRSDSQDESSTYKDGGFDLDPANPRLVPGSWLALAQGEEAPQLLRIDKVDQRSRADFALSGRVTHVGVCRPEGAPSGDLNGFKVRTTTVHAESERLELAQVPLEESVAAGTTELRLDSLAVELELGAPVAVCGEDAELDGVRWNEIVRLRKVSQVGGLTAIGFDGLAGDGSGLAHAYRRSTLRLNANVAPATHGETVADEILGSGSGLAGQRFRLARPPLTHVQDSGPTGALGTLELRIDGIRWEEARSLFGLPPDAERYLTRRDDDGSTWIAFGDGTRGASAPSGSSNLRATYRTGIGAAGEVAAGALTLLKTRPLGVRSVVNPLAPTGAEDAETLESARANAPLTALTLDRVVSLRDYEDFSRAFAGIAKARAAEIWTGARRIVHVTVAGPGGAEVAGETPANLLAALAAASDPGVEVRVDSLPPTRFGLKMTVLVERRHRPEDVAAAVRAALAERFSFERREFGQWVAGSEAVAAALAVEGAVDAHLTEFRLQLAADESPPIEDPLRAGLARLTAAGEVEPARLLHLGPGGPAVTGAPA